MGDEIVEQKLFGTFEQHGEFASIQKSFLVLDLFEEENNNEELLLFQRLCNILDEYQEQSYLLDPFLEDLVVPVVDCLRSYAKASINNRSRRGSPTRVWRLANLLYTYVKFRGYKTIIRFFPHEIGDLSIALEFLLLPDGLIQETSQWPLRYVTLIWLSLICMVPFDLAQFDNADHPGHTANTIESSAKDFLGRAGIEREAAALLLSRLYMRNDTSSKFHPFLQWSKVQLETCADVFMSIGLLRVLCEVVKSGPVEQIKMEVSQLLAIANLVDSAKVLSNNTHVRKLKTKLISRVALRLLPTVVNSGRSKGRSLTGNKVITDDIIHVTEVEVPEQVESVLAELLDALQDKDTVVRWSSAKGIARISERLPIDFIDQVLETIMGLFTIHSLAAASLYDLPAIAESTWHGACLACAEMARRDLLVSERLPELIVWLSKALHFDIRKGAHSIGSNVRDAAAYVFWALARTQGPSALAPHAVSLAQCLTAVALYDREIHIRRAASAAFQEHVGRNNLFPHGIDVLGKTDFYAVSIRRHAFLTAAPQVAEHPEYGVSLLNHVLDVVLRHWDPAMRELGSQSLRLLCLTDLSILAPQALTKSIRLLNAIDVTDIHGSLLALSEIALAYREAGETDSLDVHMRDIFRSLSTVPLDVLIGPRNAILTAAACRLISVALTPSEIESETTSVPYWKKIIDYGLKHRTPPVQEAAAQAMASVSRLTDCSSTVKRYVNRLLTQSLGTVLGAIDYSAHLNALPEALDCLIGFVQPSSPSKSNVEARRSCYSAIPRIFSTTIHNLPRHMSAETVNSLYDILINGLEDYSTDERGDVGSWIRITCIQGLKIVTATLISNASSIPGFDAYLPPLKFHSAIAKILRQGVERLDHVRQEAGECILQILDLPLPAIHNANLWELPGLSLLTELFTSDKERIGWNDGNWLFPRAIRLLEVAEYRPSVLLGLVFSLGSKTESTQRPLATSLVSFANSLPLFSEDSKYDVNSLVEDLLALAESRITSNAIVVPVWQTFIVLLEGGALGQLPDDSRGVESLRRLFSVVTKGVPRLKSVLRIQESMKIVVNLLSYKSIRPICIPGLTIFLGHQFPNVRRDTAEYIYNVLQGTDMGRETDDIEEVLLETEWSSNDVSTAKEATERVVALFST